MRPLVNRAHVERVRRAEAEDHIEGLPLDQQSAARVVELEIRTQWEAQQGLLQNNPSPPSNTCTAPGTSSQSNQGQQGVGSPPAKTRTRWRFRLKSEGSLRRWLLILSSSLTYRFLTELRAHFIS